MPYSWRSINITVKGLLPFIIGVALWGKKWLGGSVICRCNNPAVVVRLV